MKSIYQLSAFAALFAVTACSAGTSSSSLPGAATINAPDQTVASSRAALGEAPKPPPPPKPTPPPKKVKQPPPCPKDPNKGDFDFCLFGDALLVSPGNASATAAQVTTTGPNAFGGVDFHFPAGMTVSQLSNLSTDYKFTAGDCGLGSPRYDASVTNGSASGNISFYIGPPPNYQGCAPNVWTNSGNLNSPTSLMDTSQLPGGTFYDTYAHEQSAYGNYKITDIFLVADGTGQTVQFDNSAINSVVYTYEPGADNDGDKDNGAKK